MMTLQVQDSYALEPLGVVPPAGPAGAAGAAAALALPYAEVLARQQAATLVPGQQYLITDRPAPALGASGEVLATAAAPGALAPAATLCARVPDYAQVPLWCTAPPAPGPVLGVSYTQQTEPYVAVVPRFYDAVSRPLAGDESVASLSLPFAFTFGGVAYTQAQVDSNGRLVFGPGPLAPSYEPTALGAASQPTIAFAWTDLVASAATFSTFVTGEAPNRRFVLDYRRARRYPRPGSNGSTYATQDTISGQLVLEETTNRVSLGVEANTNPDTNVVQGLQYEGHGYPLSLGQALPAGVRTTFTPVEERGPAAAPAAPAGPRVVWRGRTWDLAGSAAAEPGTGPDWVPAAGAGRDAFGNDRRTYDAVVYDLATDALAERCDAAGNCVRGGSLAGFPWGHPGVQANTVRNTTLDESLLVVPDLVFANNYLVDCTLKQVSLAGVACTHNQLFGVRLADYAPTQLDHVTAYYDLDPQVPAAQQAVYVHGRAVRSELPELEAGLSAFRDQYVDNMFTTYQAGQAPGHAPLELLETTNGDYTPHDLIVVRGITKAALALRNQDYSLRGEGAAFGSAFLGAGSAPRRITLDGIAFTDVLHVHESNADGSGRGHEIHVLNSPYIKTIGVFQGAGNGALDRHTFTNCHIGVVHREAAYNGNAGHTICLDRCTLGRGVLPGAILGAYFHNPLSSLVDTYDGGTLSLCVSNSALYLSPGMSIEPAGRHSVAPYLTFENCTVIYPDGAQKSLSTSAPVYQLDTTHHAADVAALTDPSHWNTAGNGEYTGPAFAFAFPAYYESPASAAARGYRYVLDGQGHASRYAAA
jgi:hypothetical protein